MRVVSLTERNEPVDYLQEHVLRECLVHIEPWENQEHAALEKVDAPMLLGSELHPMMPLSVLPRLHGLCVLRHGILFQDLHCGTLDSTKPGMLERRQMQVRMDRLWQLKSFSHESQLIPTFAFWSQ
jgi:hypothetical protein